MDHFFESGAVSTPPTIPSPGSVGYPTDGNLGASIPPTTPGAWAFYMLMEEMRNVIVAAGLTPNPAAVNQLLSALDARYRASGGTVVSSVNGQTGDVVVPTGFAVNAVGYTAFIVVPGGPVLGTEGAVVTIAGRPGTWLINGYALAASDTWTVATRIA